MATMALQTLRRIPTGIASRVSSRANSTSSIHETDSCGIPRRPTWSVNQLLSSYPSPQISPKTINRLYELSALIPPEEGTVQYKTVTEDLQEMVRLVEAVRLVDTSGISSTGRGEKEDTDRNETYPEGPGKDGQALLKHASRTQDKFYVVDAERKR